MELSLAPTMLLIMSTVMVFSGLVDYAMTQENPEVNLINFENTLGGTLTADGTINSPLNVEYEDVALDPADSIETDVGSVFTDAIKSISSWFSDEEERFGLASSILKQPAGLMSDMKLPQIAVTAFGMIWYLMAGLALLMLVTGRT